MGDADQRAVMIALMKAAGVGHSMKPGAKQPTQEAVDCLASFVQSQDQVLEMTQQFLVELTNEALDENGVCACESQHPEDDSDEGCAVQEARELIGYIESTRDHFTRLLRLPPEALA